MAQPTGQRTSKQNLTVSVSLFLLLLPALGRDRDNRLCSFTPQRTLTIPKFWLTEGNVCYKPPLTPILMTSEMEMFPIVERRFKYRAGEACNLHSHLHTADHGKCCGCISDTQSSYSDWGSSGSTCTCHQPPSLLRLVGSQVVIIMLS